MKDRKSFRGAIEEGASVKKSLCDLVNASTEFDVSSWFGNVVDDHDECVKDRTSHVRDHFLDVGHQGLEEV